MAGNKNCRFGASWPGVEFLYSLSKAPGLGGVANEGDFATACWSHFVAADIKLKGALKGALRFSNFGYF
jgi:hypothetical protein